MVLPEWYDLVFSFHENIKVVIITSSVNEDDKKKAFSYPQVCEFLTKPIKVPDFIALQGHKDIGKLLRPIWDVSDRI